MASILRHVQRGCRSNASVAVSRTAHLTRKIHQTPIALKKQKGHAIDDGDLFGPSGGEEDAFSDAMFAEPSVEKTSKAGPSTSATAKTSRGLNSEDRLKRFTELRQFVADRIGQKPTEKLPPVRNSAWQHLFQLATTKEQMDEVVGLLPRWRDSKRQFGKHTVEVFVGRCEQLRCPTLALKVFSDHPKYGFDLTLSAARRLLHSLHVEHSLQDTITLAALFRVYKLPPISSDLVACSMFTSACFKHHSTHSLAIANEMVPHLKNLLAKVDPKSMQLPPSGAACAPIEAKEKAWTAWTLAKIEKALRKQGTEYGWLRQWREETGHTLAAS
ncbi:uncharacterized protein FIBRA_02657 [Fibroporia radiculosa]|uniref:Uncharacterized protein n=1 Tax=Fibroporia radiculosa TaxID=599839 RepID=J4I965_9APHY|nr:uncharacterized protein FIBRA_02657 [Fibroporia radiculosa]CCM00621.1 predicted protein [Fibroporia radiculosa]